MCSGSSDASAAGNLRGSLRAGNAAAAQSDKGNAPAPGALAASQVRTQGLVLSGHFLAR